MSTTDKKTADKKTSKKQAKLEIAELLEKALAGMKVHMGEKKFKSSIKKASKLFVNAVTPKKEVKKAAPKKVAATTKAAKAPKTPVRKS